MRREEQRLSRALNIVIYQINHNLHINLQVIHLDNPTHLTMRSPALMFGSSCRFQDLASLIIVRTVSRLSMLRLFTTVAVTSVLFAGPVFAVDDPIHGRPRYEKIDGMEWIFYMSDNGTDWYIQSKVQTGDIAKTLIRGVSPGIDSYGMFQIDCNKKMVSEYYEKWHKFPPNSKLISRFYKDFCNLKIAY